MKDFGGFLILILVMFAGLYITVRLLLPLLFVYASGMLLFLMVSRSLMKKGRRYRIRLNCYLKPGYPALLAASSVLLPSIHAFVVYLLRLSDYWLAIGIVNIVPPVAWTARVLWLHSIQARRFITEGHDIEEMIEASKSRAGLLDLKIQILTAAAETEGDPEPWEYAIGMPYSAMPDRHEEINVLIHKMKELREMYQNVSDELDGGHDERGKARRRHLTAEIGVPTQARLKRLDSLWIEVSTESSRLLTETIGYSSYGWEAVS